MNQPTLIFGGGTVGDSFSTPADVTALLESLKTLGIPRIDTASRYPPTAPGQSEKLLGEARVVDHGFTVDTKINVLGDGRGSLTAEAIDTSIKDSLQRLGVQKVCYGFSTATLCRRADGKPNKVNVLYCHMPDVQTPIKETAAAFNKHYGRGVFTRVRVYLPSWKGISHSLTLFK